MEKKKKMIVIETEGLCFLCLKPPQIQIQLQDEKEEGESNPGLFSLREISRTLKINLEDVLRYLSPGLSPSEEAAETDRELMGTVCGECRLEVETASKLAVQLEVIRMQMQSRWKNLHKRMVEGDREQFCDKMLKNPRTWQVYGTLEWLRRETMQKCLDKAGEGSAKVVLEKLQVFYPDPPKVKEEPEPTTGEGAIVAVATSSSGIEDEPDVEPEAASTGQATSLDVEVESNYQMGDEVDVEVEINSDRHDGTESGREAEVATPHPEPAQSEIFKCDLCPRKFKSSETLASHKLHFHSKTKKQLKSEPNPLVELREDGESCRDLDGGRRKRQRGTPSGPEEGEEEGASTPKKPVLREGVISSSPPELPKKRVRCIRVTSQFQPFPCVGCRQRFTRQDQLEIHNKETHRRLRCISCSTVFPTIEDLKEHKTMKVCEKLEGGEGEGQTMIICTATGEVAVVSSKDEEKGQNDEPSVSPEVISSFEQPD